MLLYFKNESRCKLLGEIDIGGSCYDVCLGADKIKVSFPATIPANCCFSFSVLKRTYYLYASAESEAKRWIECIAHVSGVLRRKREVQYKASFRRDQQPPLRDRGGESAAGRRERQLNRHSYTDSVKTDSQEDEDTVAELPVFGSDKGAMRYSSVPTRLDDLRETAEAPAGHAASTLHLQSATHTATNPNFFTLQYERRSPPTKKISFSSNLGESRGGEQSPHRAESNSTGGERPSSAPKGDAFASYAKNLEQLEKQEAELRQRMKDLDSPPPKRSASVLLIGKAKDEYAQAVALGVPILPSIMKQRSQSDVSSTGASGPPIMPKPILRNSGRRKEPFSMTTTKLNDAATTPSSSSSNVGDFVGDHIGAPESPTPPPLPPKPAALPPAPPCPPSLTPPSTPCVNTNATASPSSVTTQPSTGWQTSDYWGLNGAKSSSARADDASRWAREEMKKLVSEIKRLGQANSEGKTTVTYGDLMAGTDRLFEALLGTLLSAKRHKMVSFEPESLFQGRDDAAVITLLKEDACFHD